MIEDAVLFTFVTDRRCAVFPQCISTESISANAVDLPSSSSVRNRSKNSLVSKKSFILVKFNHFSSFQNKLEVSITIFRFMGNLKKKNFFSRAGTLSREKISELQFFFFFFVIIFSRFSCECYIKSYIQKCSQLVVEYNQKIIPSYYPLYFRCISIYIKLR